MLYQEKSGHHEINVTKINSCSQNEVRKIRVSKRENFVINRLNKTKKEVKNPDLRAEREQRDRQVGPVPLFSFWG
jgi:hypothetical protein